MIWSFLEQSGGDWRSRLELSVWPSLEPVGAVQLRLEPSGGFLRCRVLLGEVTRVGAARASLPQDVRGRLAQLLATIRDSHFSRAFSCV